MRKLLLVVSSLFIGSITFAQKQADKWYFGNGVGLDFASGTPSLIASGNASYTPSEGCSVISDAAGNLLFYTDGQNVYNNSHLQMANGFGLLGGISSSQAALIVPQGSNGIYYIFTTDDYGGPNGFRYSVVDMNLAAGQGSVTIKNSPLINTVAEKVTAVKDPFNSRYWIVAHEWPTNGFYAYSLTSTGLSAPVISYVGTVHTGSMQNTYGEMKFNPCGNKLAVAIGYMNIWEYFDFSTNTGVVSNPMSFGMSDHVYGIDFSPNASKVYVSCYDPLNTLIQFDVTSNNQSLIAASQVSLSTTPSIYGIQLANDGKVYVCKSFSQYIGVINSPDLAGVASNYNDTQLNVDPSFMGITASLAFPEFVQSDFLPNSFTCPVPLGVNEIQVLNKPTVIYPNPSADGFNILIEQPSSIQVYSFTGKLVEELTVGKSKTITIGENYSAGIYFVKINSGDKIETSKIIKD